MKAVKWGIAVMCASGIGAAMAQGAQVGAAEKTKAPPPNVMVLKPVVVGQATGAAANGASTAKATTDTAVSTGTLVFIGAAVAGVAAAASNGGGTVTHATVTHAP